MSNEKEILIKAKLTLSIYHKDIETFKSLYSQYKDYIISIGDSRINTIADEVRTKIANMLGYYPEHAESMLEFTDKVFIESDMFPDELKEYESIMFRIKHGNYQHNHNLELIDKLKLIAPAYKKNELLVLELDEANEALDMMRVSSILRQMGE